MVNLLLKNAHVLTMDQAGTTFPCGFVAVQGSKISQTGPMADCPGADGVETVIDCTGCIVIPGLINAHTHLPMSYFRGLADDLQLMDWLENHIFPAEKKYLSPDFVYQAALLGIAESFKSGVTSVNDMYLFAADVARACEDAGMRAFVGEGVTTSPTPSALTWRKGLKLTEKLLDKYQGHETVTPTVCPHSPYACDKPSLLALRELADAHGALFHIHLHETYGESDMIGWADSEDTPTHSLMNLGVLGPRTVAAHCVWIDDHDLSHLRENQCAIAHCPSSNLKLGSGIAPVHSMLEADVTVCVGTDGAASNNNLNMVEEIHLAAMLAKGVYKDATVVPAEQALRFATSEGARGLCAGHIGSIEPGKCADMAVVSTNGTHAVPRFNSDGSVYSQLVYASQGSDVRDTIVNGKVVMRSRELLTLDEEKLYAGANEWATSEFG